jgi:sugar phosphate isomerase/epimerase
MEPKLPIAAITDEYSMDLDKALDAMKATGMTGAELRMIGGKNIVDLSDEELDRAIDACRGRGFEIMSIASPLLKCVLPGAPDIDPRFQQDVFGAQHTFEDQPRIMDRALEIARRSGARIIRVFTFWRTVAPENCFDGIVKALSDLCEKAAGENVIIGLENEHACNIATAAETAKVLEAIDHPNLQVVWDPANALVSGENPFPDGYRLLPANRIAHVHAKDCQMGGHKPDWGPLGTRQVDWRGQIAALLADGYRGYLSLETHWPGPDGDKFQASWICGWNLRGLAAA